MDNITHSLAGIVTAELIVQARARSGARPAIDPRWHRAAWLVSIGAHNAPDLDFAYTAITGGRLGYLLHHRGHTHTLLLAPLMAALPLVIAWLWSRRRALAWSRADLAWLSGIAMLGPLGHVALDASNNYGVHPFWPISGEWLAGDTIFIVEPLFFACTIPLAIAETIGRRGKIAWGATLAVFLALPWLAAITGWPVTIRWPFALGATVLAVIVGAITARTRAPGRAILALAASLVVLAIFAISGRAAEASLRARLGADDPGATVIDVARSPTAATPACWQAVALTLEGDRYALHVAHVSAWPSIVSPSWCAPAREPVRTLYAGDTPSPRAEGATILVARYEASARALRASASRCDVHAALRFVRMPFVLERGAGIVVGDLRFDREEGLGFAELELPSVAPETCPAFVPPWTPWRAQDLLRPIE